LANPFPEITSVFKIVLLIILAFSSVFIFAQNLEMRGH